MKGKGRTRSVASAVACVAAAVVLFTFTGCSALGSDLTPPSKAEKTANIQELVRRGFTDPTYEATTDSPDYLGKLYVYDVKFGSCRIRINRTDETGAYFYGYGKSMVGDVSATTLKASAKKVGLLNCVNS